MNDSTRLAVQTTAGTEYYKIIDVEQLADARTAGELAVIHCISNTERIQFVGIWLAK